MINVSYLTQSVWVDYLILSLWKEYKFLFLYNMSYERDI